MSSDLSIDVEKGEKILYARQPTVSTGSAGPIPVPPPRKRSVLARVRMTLRKWYKRLGLKHVASLGIVILYTLLGGLAFLAVEYYSDLSDNVKLYEIYSRLPDELYETVLNCTNSPEFGVTENRTTCVNNIKTLIEQYDEKVERDPITNTTIWDFWYSVYFACTIYTTIGYGDIYCKTVAGRLLTMLYALFGIPLLLTTLNDLGKALFNLLHKLIKYYEKCTNYMWSFYNQYLGPKPEKPPNQTDVLTPDSRIKYCTVAEVHEDFEEETTHPIQMPAETSDVKTNEKENAVVTLGDSEVEEEENEEDDDREIPVSVALVVTVGWIFGCAALFCAWETSWSYFSSIYFFFISLTTIGLGDVTPEHPKYMIIAYGLVIIGLSLVSMCISVIQRKLEKLYYQLLQMILDEYTKQLATGNNQLGATMGMMRMWNQNSKAKLLVPLLSKAAKELVAQKFQEEKEAEGISLPPVLKQMDKSTGMPVMFSVAKQEEVEEPEYFEAAVMESLQKAENMAVARKESVVSVKLDEPEVAARVPAVLYDASTETEKLSLEDKHEQTTIVECFDEQVQTEGAATYLKVDEASQTLVIDQEVAEVQTINADMMNEETQTTVISKKDALNQTTTLVSVDQELQTHLYDLTDQELQTDPPNTKNQRIQTPIPELEDSAAQTDPLPKEIRPQHKGKGSHAGQGGFAANARKKIQKALSKGGKKKDQKPEPEVKQVPSEPELATWADVMGDAGSELGDKDKGDEEEEEEIEEDEDEEEEEEEEELPEKDLEWDPIDGMHAEKQKKVRDLKKMFEIP